MRFGRSRDFEARRGSKRRFGAGTKDENHRVRFSFMKDGAFWELGNYLTPNNRQELLAAASGKTKLQVQELLARRFPRPDVPSTIRKLPARREPAAPRDTAAERHTTEQRDMAEQPVPATSLVTSSASEADSPWTTSSPPAIAIHAAGSVTSGPPAKTPEPRPTPTLPARCAVVEPLSAARYRIQLNASPQLKEKLEQARDLLSHANPSGDLTMVIERALDMLIERTLKQRFAQTKRPRSHRDADRAGRADRRFGQENAEKPKVVHDDTQRRRTHRGHIANATKREIAARDGLRCTFVGSDGQRCGASRFTQIHHEQPWARRGDDAPGNLRILCASHNHLLAERDFGRDLVANRIQSRRISARASPADASET